MPVPPAPCPKPPFAEVEEDTEDVVGELSDVE